MIPPQLLWYGIYAMHVRLKRYNALIHIASASNDINFAQILTGHEKGVLSLSWCKQDADLLLSCGKDNRALCWNPQTSEIIGEVRSSLFYCFLLLTSNLVALGG